jgi:hypothetical protein
VPDVINYDATSLNPLRREYMLLSRSPGVPVSDIYDTLSQVQLESLISQLIVIQEELHTHEFDVIGGMMHSPEDPNTIISGPIVGTSNVLINIIFISSCPPRIVSSYLYTAQIEANKKNIIRLLSVPVQKFKILTKGNCNE